MLSALVSKALSSLYTELGSIFSLEKLILEVASRRGKPIKIIYASLKPNATGFCLSLTDMDLICITNSVDELHKLNILLHELAHLLLSHIPRYPEGDDAYSFDEFMVKVDTKNAQHRHGSLYDSKKESDAESLARALLIIINNYNSSLPDVAQDVYN